MDDLLLALLDVLFWLFIIPDTKKPNWIGMLFVVLVVVLVTYFVL